MPLTVRENVNNLIRLVEQGKFLEAIQEFYAQDASMQENNEPPRQGLAKLLEHERQVLTRFKEMHVSRAESVLVDGNLAAINWTFEYTVPDGRRFRLEEVAFQVWQDGKIIRERFYYDPGQRSVEIEPEAQLASAEAK
ncbi:MAG TPA: nuclear transport factor 2 family protein [Bryobacteraceae bacterium]|nr:nuclear transport factor 2 family protein [Bryobacteraceae bacterium]